MKHFLLVLLIALVATAAGGSLLREASAQPEQNRRPGKAELAEMRSEEIRPEWFAPGNVSDWSKAIEAATRAAVEQGGNTVKFTCGKTYRVDKPINFAAEANVFILHSVRWQGCGSDYEFSSGAPTIEYTGGGDDSAFDFRTSYGVRVERMRIRYTNPNFRGRLFDFRHSAIADGGTGGDSSYFAVRDSTLTGTETANQAILLDLGGAIIGEITKSHFFDARVGIKGASPVSDGRANHYAYVFTVARNSFNRVDQAILNYSSNWTIDNNAFEPNKDGKVISVANDCGALCSFAAGVTYSNNYHGDGHAQMEPMARFVHTYGLNVFGNKFYVEGNSARTAIELDACEGVSVAGNFAGLFEAFLETRGGTSWGVETRANKLNVKEILRESAVCAGCSFFEPSKAGTSPRMSKVSALVASDYAADAGVYDVAIGWKANEQHFNSGGVFSSMDGSYGMLGGSVGIFAGKNNDAPVFFATDNKVRAVVNGAGFVSKVPVILPSGEKFGESWKNSNEAVTKADVYAALKAHLAEVAALTDTKQRTQNKTTGEK